MHLFVRADADAKIGTGHIMRCIALAQAWQDRGGIATFISHCESEALRDRISKEGFQFIAIENPHPHPDDLAQTIDYLKRSSPLTTFPSPTCLVLDGYHFTPEYQQAIRDAGHRLLVIDDMNHLPHYHADILLNQNIYAPELKYHSDVDTTILLGTRYVLLRREFLKYRDFRCQIPERAKNILVTLGGADPDNVTLKVIEALELLDEPSISVRIITGPANIHKETLRKALASAHFEAELIVNPSNIPELMAWADMAISGGGSTCWELCFKGLPSLLVICAKNQVALVKHLEAKEACVNIGWYNTFTGEQLCAKLNLLIHDMSLRKSLSENASSFVDGGGVSNVITSMYDRRIALRQAIHDDCNLIWQWSNEKETRQVSFNKNPILWDEHIQWFKEKLADSSHVFFIAADDNKNPIGQIRYAIEGSKATLSFSIEPKSRTLGYGSGLLRVAARKLFHETGVDEILAFVKADNPASSKTLQNAGFKKTKELTIHSIKTYKFILRRTELT